MLRYLSVDDGLMSGVVYAYKSYQKYFPINVSAKFKSFLTHGDFAFSQGYIGATAGIY